MRAKKIFRSTGKICVRMGIYPHHASNKAGSEYTYNCKHALTMCKLWIVKTNVLCSDADAMDEFICDDSGKFFIDTRSNVNIAHYILRRNMVSYV